MIRCEAGKCVGSVGKSQFVVRLAVRKKRGCTARHEPGTWASKCSTSRDSWALGDDPTWRRLLVWDIAVFVDARMLQIESNEMATHGEKRGQERAEHGIEYIAVQPP